MFATYTTPETVRALLGISRFEVKDEQFLLPLYDTVADDALESLNSSLAANFAAVVLVNVASRTALQKRFYAAAQLYVALAVALYLLPSLPMAAPRKVGDGAAVQERVNDPYALLVDSLSGTLAAMGIKLLALLVLIDPTAPGAAIPARVYAVSVGLVFDPVTGV